MQLRLRSRGYITAWGWRLARCMCCFLLLSPLTHSAAGFGLYLFSFTHAAIRFYSLAANWGCRIGRGGKCTHVSEFATAGVGWAHRTLRKAALLSLMTTLHCPGLNEGATDVPSPPDKGSVTFWPWTVVPESFWRRLFYKVVRRVGFEVRLRGLNFSSITCVGKLLVLPKPLFSPQCNGNT